MELSGMTGLVMAVRGKECVMASDATLLEQMLKARAAAKTEPRVAAVVAGFSQAGEREPMERLAMVLDRQKLKTPAGTEPGGEDSSQGTPAFFTGNMASLSDSFRDLDSETFVASAAKGAITHQTVVYAWRR